MEDAREKSSRLYDEYAAALEQSFEEHKKEAARRLEMQLQGESEKLDREMNKKLALAQINLKRMLSKRQEELKDMLFVEVRNMLADFMATPDYPKLLEKQIQAAQKLAGSNDIIIYIDPADSPLLQRLSLTNRDAVRISEYSFLGGIRAVVPQSHILIDNSFQTKLEEAKHNFHFHLGGKGHE
jgi:ATP synthase, subunit E